MPEQAEPLYSSGAVILNDFSGQNQCIILRTTTKNTVYNKGINTFIHRILDHNLVENLGISIMLHYTIYLDHVLNWDMVFRKL